MLPRPTGCKARVPSHRKADVHGVTHGPSVQQRRCEWGGWAGGLEGPQSSRAPGLDLHPETTGTPAHWARRADHTLSVCFAVKQK